MDKFKTVKKGYDKDEVDAYILRIEETLTRQKERIEALLNEAAKIQAENISFRQREALIAQSLLSATEKAREVENAARQKYAADMANLTAFHEQWLTYYKKLLERYPLNEDLASLNAFNENLTAVLTGDLEGDALMSEASAQFKRENERLTRRYGCLPMGDDDDVPEFNPEQTIRTLLRRQALEEEQKRARKPLPEAKKPAKQRKKKSSQADDVCAVGDDAEGGFSYEEALNPTQSLSEILQDLGLDMPE